MQHLNSEPTKWPKSAFAFQGFFDHLLIRHLIGARHDLSARAEARQTCTRSDILSYRLRWRFWVCRAQPAVNEAAQAAKAIYGCLGDGILLMHLCSGPQLASFVIRDGTPVQQLLAMDYKTVAKDAERQGMATQTTNSNPEYVLRFLQTSGMLLPPGGHLATRRLASV